MADLKPSLLTPPTTSSEAEVSSVPEPKYPFSGLSFFQQPEDLTQSPVPSREFTDSSAYATDGLRITEWRGPFANM